MTANTKLKGKSALLVMTIIFLSACVTRDVRTDANNGLAINKFFTDPERVDSGDLFDVHAEIENVGERTAKKIFFELISSAFEDLEIKPKPGIVKIGQPLPEFGATETSRKVAILQSLAPPKPEFNQPGDFRTFSWTLQAPLLPEGVVKDFRLLGRLIYEYSTSSVINIPVYTKNEFRQQKTPKSVEIENTRGPVKVEISGPRQIVVNTDPDAININRNEILVYTITVKNSGDGIPITNRINGLVTGSVWFIGGITPLDCLSERKEKIPSVPLVQLPSQQAYKIFQPSQPTYDSGTYRIDLLGDENGLILRDGKEVTFSCTIGLDRSQWISRPFGTATISFDLNYLYFIEKEAAVAVRGVRA